MTDQHTDIEKYLLPTQIIDSKHESIINFAKDTIKDADRNDLVTIAVRLYYAVRDSIWYDPYSPFYLPEHYQASNVLKTRRGFCISKASLLCALGRSCGIPSRAGFATVRNHLATKQLIEFMGTDLFVYHGFTEFFLNGKWVKATPAFNIELCKKHKVAPLEFNGLEDSIFHPYGTEKQKFMEYTEYHRTYSDIPVDVIVAEWEKTYGKERVSEWIAGLEKLGGKSGRNFDKEDVLEQ
ncbi:MAG: transglutaminase domain-containing protein [Desulfobacterales bacterium]|nr:transglutaminase domain-containing protein [Desulfobacterales bacterium]